MSSAHTQQDIDKYVASLNELEKKAYEIAKSDLGSSFDIEKSIFLGNKNRIINNESIAMSGKINEEIVTIKWMLEKVN